MFAFSCFVGFEATTIYGEEARDPATDRRVEIRASIVVNATGPGLDRSLAEMSGQNVVVPEVGVPFSI